MLYSVRYCFSQRFAVPAKAAYEWCTDYASDDHTIMQHKGAKREVTWLTAGIVLLKDIFVGSSGTVEKEKLVHLYPDQLTYVSTHLSGPIKHSQFIYRITADGNSGSHLDFTASYIGNLESPTPKDLKQLADKLCREDSNTWRLIAAAMEKELHE